jgi:hypothetical protein
MNCLVAQQRRRLHINRRRSQMGSYDWSMRVLAPMYAENSVYFRTSEPMLSSI